MPTQLQMYNLALLNIKETVLASISENREARYVLDAFYGQTLKEMIEAGFWKFAIRTVQIAADAAITPAFGYPNAFNLPSDWVKTYQVSASETLDPPLDDWIEESNVFMSNVTPIYLRYVSNQANGYGYDGDRWTGRFVKAFSWRLSAAISPKAMGASENSKGSIDQLADDYLKQALSFEALREPPRRIQPGKWNKGRMGRRSNSDYWRYG